MATDDPWGYGCADGCYVSVSGGGERCGQSWVHYSPGDQFTIWDIDGVRCGAQICYDYRYPELYRQYSGLGVQLMFHSFHVVSAPNSSARQSLWPALFVRADGITTGRLRRNIPGVLISTVTPSRTSTTRPVTGGLAPSPASCTVGTGTQLMMPLHWSVIHCPVA
jgi:hypothetical protein